MPARVLLVAGKDDEVVRAAKGLAGADTLEVGPLTVPSPDVSWVVGAGLQWERKDIGIGLEARFQRGLRQVLPDAATPIYNELWAIVLALTI